MRVSSARARPKKVTMGPCGDDGVADRVGDEVGLAVPDRVGVGVDARVAVRVGVRVRVSVAETVAVPPPGLKVGVSVGAPGVIGVLVLVDVDVAVGL
jgi:hypothetical protein